jgi:aminoglycoside 6'-N-acetyltransferase
VTAVDLTPLSRADLPLVARWLTEPHVARFWQADAGLDAVTAYYGPALDGNEPTEMLLIRAAGRPVGMIQRYAISDYPDWARAFPAGLIDPSAAGIDYLIGEADALRQGIGSAAIAAVAARCFTDAATQQVVAAPQQANTGSWRALERVGFARLWAGQLDSDDPSDAGPAYVYALDRPVQFRRRS